MNLNRFGDEKMTLNLPTGNPGQDLLDDINRHRRQDLLDEANRHRRQDKAIQDRINASRERRHAATQEARQGQQIIGTGMGRVAARGVPYLPVVRATAEV